jgi:hypothetical protein
VEVLEALRLISYYIHRCYIVASLTSTLFIQCFILLILAYQYECQQEVIQANSDPHDWFGYSVSISGGTIVVGAPLEDSDATGVNGNQNNNAANDSGAAYVFVRGSTGWTLQA